MADLSSNFIGIKSPNPFWLASAPPTDKATWAERRAALFRVTDLAVLVIVVMGGIIGAGPQQRDMAAVVGRRLDRAVAQNRFKVEFGTFDWRLNDLTGGRID